MQLLLVKDGKDLNDWVWVWSEEEEAAKRAQGYAIFGENVWPQAEEMAVEDPHAPPAVSAELKEAAKAFRPRGRPRKAAP